MCNLRKWGEDDKLVYLMAALDGPAVQSLQSCKDRLTYANLLEKLHRRYGSEHQLSVIDRNYALDDNALTKVYKLFATTLRKWRH